MQPLIVPANVIIPLSLNFILKLFKPDILWFNIIFYSIIKDVPNIDTILEKNRIISSHKTNVREKTLEK